ncbi:MAG: hypothetical protein PHF31_07235 [Methylobacter sp.]|nr:hypothetical protein [Methylobacter sp.]
MQYQLKINISTTGLNNIYAAYQTVTLCKQVTYYVSTSKAATSVMPSLVWIAFEPLQVNTVIWTNNYSVYASGTALQPGNTISPNSSIPAQNSMLYTFSDGCFTAGTTGGANTINVANQENSGTYNFGLTQQASINGVSATTPVNCVPILYNEQANFTTSEMVYIFLSSCESGGGIVISQLPTGALTVSLSSQDSSATIGFNDTTNLFYIS